LEILTTSFLQTALETGVYTLSANFPLHLLNPKYPKDPKTFGQKLRAARIEAGFDIKGCSEGW
jgi:hypothetical protein